MFSSQITDLKFWIEHFSEKWREKYQNEIFSFLSHHPQWAVNLKQILLLCL